MTAATSLDLLATLAELVALLERGETPPGSLVRVAGDAVRDLRRRHSPDLLVALRGMLSIHDSVTLGQERERRDEWVPRARAIVAAEEGRA